MTLGPVQIRWYGVIITSAVVIGYAIARRRAINAGEDPEHLTNILVYGLLGALIGARAYYVLFNLSDYLKDPAEMFAVWHGGLAIHGAFIAALGTTYLYTRFNGLDFWCWTDLMIPSMILGQAIGRWGNFINQEAFGTPTDLPWGIYIDPAKRPIEYISQSYFHPTFLYESIWDLAGFALLLYISRLQKKDGRKWPKGSLLMIYGVYYSFGRFLIEGLRTDSLMLGHIRVAQLVSLAAVIGCSAVLIAWRIRNRAPGAREAKQGTA